MEDTIVALTTGTGNCSISVLRLSGPQSGKIIREIFIPRHPKRFDRNENYTAHIGQISFHDQLIDEVLILRMRAPSSYTGEDVYEISCHGGLWITEKIIHACLTLGARLAEPGEFTKRAFLNGKLDLIQAEAIIDLIEARTDGGAGLALSQLQGKLSNSIYSLRQDVLDLLSFIEASIDFPEDEVDDMDLTQLTEMMKKTLAGMDDLLAGSRTGKVLRDGLLTAIVGRPNVGKSSLLNALLQEERAIVTDIPGTTRDEIRESVSIAGILLQLVDTAGIRASDDVVERLGIERTWKVLGQADLILLVRQAGAQLTPEEEEILKSYGEKVIVINNKIDLLKHRDIKPLINQGTWLSFSVLQHAGFDELEREIEGRVYQGSLEKKDQPFLSNLRQISALERSREALDQAVAASYQGMPWDILSVDVRRSLTELSQMTGDDVQESLLDNIFSRFCIGK